MPVVVLSLREMVGGGKSLATAAATVGISRSTAHRLLQRWGMGGGTRRRSRRLTAKQRAMIARLLDAGLSQRQVATKVRCDRRTVARVGNGANGVTIADCKPRRCDSCGYRITTMDCLVCLARSA